MLVGWELLYKISKQQGAGLARRDELAANWPGFECDPRPFAACLFISIIMQNFP